MSTFLVSLGVTTVVIACVAWLALRCADQTATISPNTRRGLGSPPSPRLPPTPDPVVSAQPAFEAPPPVLTTRTGPRDPIPVSTHRTLRAPAAGQVALEAPESRVRAGFALGVLVTFAGVLVALAVSAVILIAVSGLRDSVR